MKREIKYFKPSRDKDVSIQNDMCQIYLFLGISKNGCMRLKIVHACNN